MVEPGSARRIRSTTWSRITVCCERTLLSGALNAEPFEAACAVSGLASTTARARRQAMKAGRDLPGTTRPHELRKRFPPLIASDRNPRGGMMT